MMDDIPFKDHSTFPSKVVASNGTGSGGHNFRGCVVSPDERSCPVALFVAIDFPQLLTGQLVQCQK